MQDKSKYLYAFEAEVHRLLGDRRAEFFAKYPAMNDAKWTMAHFHHGKGTPAADGAAEWFTECIQPKLDGRIDSDDLDDFTRGYAACALWAENDDEGDPLDNNFGIEDFAEKALLEMVEDCRKFQADNAADVIVEPLERDSSIAERAGHNFWLTRNGHGSGFWDMEYEDKAVGERLTEAAKAFGESHPYIGDDGKIYVE